MRIIISSLQIPKTFQLPKTKNAPFLLLQTSCSALIFPHSHKLLLFSDLLLQHHSHRSQYWRCWDSTGRTGHHGDRADFCGAAHRRHHSHHSSRLGPVSAAASVSLSAKLCVFLALSLFSNMTIVHLLGFLPGIDSGPWSM